MLHNFWRQAPANASCSTGAAEAKLPDAIGRVWRWAINLRCEAQRSFSTFGEAERAGAREDLQTYWFAAQTINGSTLRGASHENFSNAGRGHRYLSGRMRQGSRPEG